MHNAISLLLLTSSVTTFAIAFIVYFSSPRHTENAALALSIVCSGFWSVAILLTLLTGDILVGRIAFASSALIPGLLVVFLLFFPPRYTHARLFSILVMVPSVALAAASLSDGYVLRAIKAYPDHIIITQPGALLPAYYIVFGLSIVLVFALFLIRILHARGLARIQLGYIAVGVLATILLATIANLVLPAFGVYSYNSLGPVFTLFMASSMLYAITKHHILEIKVVLTEVWGFSVSVVLLIWLVLNQTLINLVIFLAVLLTTSLFVRSALEEAEKSRELERANERLEGDKKKLIELDKMKDEFIQMATHELSTPIAAIEGRLDMGIEDNLAKLNPEQKAFFEPILVNTERLSKLSRDILEATMIDQHKMQLNLSKVDLDKLLADVISKLTEEAQKAGTKLVYEKLKYPLPKVTADQEKIAEVVTNLVTNAITFTKKGSVTVRAEVEGDYVRVSVTDTGVGISKENQKLLFHKFFQAGRFDPSHPQEQQGTGLGLYICRSIVELHGGDMGVTSTLGKGSTFSFTLPMQQESVFRTEPLRFK